MKGKRILTGLLYVLLMLFLIIACTSEDNEQNSDVVFRGGTIKVTVTEDTVKEIKKHEEETKPDIREFSFQVQSEKPINEKNTQCFVVYHFTDEFQFKVQGVVTSIDTNTVNCLIVFPSDAKEFIEAENNIEENIEFVYRISEDNVLRFEEELDSLDSSVY